MKRQILASGDITNLNRIVLCTIETQKRCHHCDGQYYALKTSLEGVVEINHAQCHGCGRLTPFIHDNFGDDFYIIKNMSSPWPMSS